ncbi:MAG TPA: DUF177 domain-containing protein [Candidatus Omnitrophota bacterium]|nr:DUF177 domain-containing protein [Candidatus Omnitrophota bacterium]HQL41472.1 DUF177 domain-containing protein [Candidatus Omnitrophota bacterium]
MKFDIRSISSTGCAVEGFLKQEDFCVRIHEIECLAPIQLSGRIEKTSAMVRAQINVKTVFRYICGRCLETCDKEFCEHLDLHYPVESQENYIDIGEDVRQEILLGFPDRVVCQDQCKGLCPRCGVNLNQEQCGCGKNE